MRRIHNTIVDSRRTTFPKKKGFRLLYDMTGTMNAAAMWGHPPGTLLFLGVDLKSTSRNRCRISLRWQILPQVYRRADHKKLLETLTP